MTPVPCEILPPWRAPTPVRTGDLRLTTALLCRLSYRGIHIKNGCQNAYRLLGDQGSNLKPPGPKPGALPVAPPPTLCDLLDWVNIARSKVIPMKSVSISNTHFVMCRIFLIIFIEPPTRLERVTYCLQDSCSAR
jgi:hypothetical protein